MAGLCGGNFITLQRHFLSLLGVLGQTGGLQGGQAVFFWWLLPTLGGI